MLCPGGVGKFKTLKFVINAKYKPHNRWPEIGDRNRGCCVQGKGIGENINDKTKQEAHADKYGPVFLDRVPVEEKDVNHRIDKTEEIEPVKNQYLYKNQQGKSQCIDKISTTVHCLLRLLVPGFPHDSDCR